MHSTISPNAYVALSLPSDTVKVEQLVPNTTIALGKYGAFQANQILGRPYYLTFEILEKSDGQDAQSLRIVTAAEIHTETLIDEASTPAESGDGESVPGDVEAHSGANGETMRTNRKTVDDPERQKMTMDEIEALKKRATGSGKDIINKLLQSHSALDQKTAFSLAKYTSRKNKKYLKRFTVLPLDVPMLTQWMLMERDAMKIMELKDEILGLIGCWANIHYGGCSSDEAPEVQRGNRYLIVDETGGLLVAAMAERMGILYSPEETDNEEQSSSTPEVEPIHQSSLEPPDLPNGTLSIPSGPSLPSHSARIPGMSATSNTLTLLHSNSQPNLSLLKYFSYDANNPAPTHPLHTHLKTLSWLQLLSPHSDPVYTEPSPIPDSILTTWKGSRRSIYHRKRRRWARIKSVIDETRAGGFNGLVVASFMNPTSILRHAVPLLAGAAQVVVYSPHIEPLMELADLYSTARRAAFIQSGLTADDLPTDDFPVDPTTLLPSTVQTSRVRKWQVLPGRTHPLMMGRGGAEGYVFVATRVLPAKGKVEARGKVGRGNKKRKVQGEAKGDDEMVGSGPRGEVADVLEPVELGGNMS